MVRDLFRVESRNIFYGGAGSGTSSTVRLRNRLEFLVPLNKERLSDDGARYLLADWEWFAPVDEPKERFANKQRIRAGLDIVRASSGGSSSSTCGRGLATPSMKGSVRRTTSSICE